MRHVSTTRAEATYLIELTSSECIMLETALRLVGSHTYEPLAGHETITGLNVKYYLDKFRAIRRS